jgi:hypothetical protein
MKVVHFNHDCMCDGVPCYTGCGDYRKAAGAGCASPINPGARPSDQLHMFLAEETATAVDANCTRSTRALNLARAGADTAMIIARQGTATKDLVPGIDKYSELAQTETLEMQHVNIPVGMVTHAQGAVPPSLHARVQHTCIICMHAHHTLVTHAQGVLPSTLPACVRECTTHASSACMRTTRAVGDCARHQPAHLCPCIGGQQWMVAKPGAVEVDPHAQLGSVQMRTMHVGDAHAQQTCPVHSCSKAC